MDPETIDIREKFGEIVPNYVDISQVGDGGGLGSIVSAIVGLAIVLVGLAVFVYFVWGAYEWLTAGGDKAKVESARTRLTNALIGLALVVSAFAFFRIIDDFFGIGLTDGSSTSVKSGSGSNSSGLSDFEGPDYSCCPPGQRCTCP